MNDMATSTHAALETLEYEDGILLWGGRRVTEIAAELGRTPFYAYDGKRIRQQIERLRSTMPPELKLHYAVKANPLPAVVNFVSRMVDGLDVASAGELAVALQTNTAADDISFAGPGKRPDELTAAVQSGITINVESEGEVARIVQIAEVTGLTPRIALRVNPLFELKSSGMKMGGRPSQFGIDSERIPGLIADIRVMNLDLCGLHIFSGSQNLRAEAIVESIEKSAALVVELADRSGLHPRIINLGGGLGIPYFAGEKPLDLTPIGEATAVAVETLTGLFGETEIIMELGRFLVGESGIYVARVIDVKKSRGMSFGVCDGGLHHHLAASGNFGQVLRKNYPIAVVEPGTGPREPISIVGPLCTPLDLLGDRVELPLIQPGALIAVLQSGAYGASASPQNFLSHPECEEILFTDDEQLDSHTMSSRA